MATVFVNEFHYDNAGADAGEFIEVAGPAGTNLAGWRLVLYNGSNGQAYAPTGGSTAGIPLSGAIPDQQNGYGTLSFAAPGLQNGSPDGFALVDALGNVVQFLSYEGSFTATNGPASGMTSTDLGVTQPDSTPVGQTLRLVGVGTDSSHFTWAAPDAGNAGAVNAGQTFGAAPSLSIGDLALAEGDAGTTTFTFTVTRSGITGTAISASWAVSHGSTDAGDFPGALPGGTVSFAAGQTSATIEVAIAGDTAIELDDTFTVTLSAPTGGAVLADAVASGTIANDDAPPPPANVFFNEFHYDNDSTDAGERIEVAGAAGTDLTGWRIVLYNGSSGQAYAPTGGSAAGIPLAGLIPDQQNGLGMLSFAAPGLQNGSPDGFALVDPFGRVVQFLSYEGSFTATNGPAAGLVSTPVGPEEGGSSPLGQSLQLAGAGSAYEDFAWAPSGPDTFDAINAGQSFLSTTGTSLVRVADVTVVEGDAGTTDMVLTVRRAGGSDTAISVDYAIALDGGASADDLAPGAVLSGTLQFAAGVVAVTVTLPVLGDVEGELNEALTLTLSNPIGDVAFADDEAVGTIRNDDVIALTIPEIQGAGHASAFVGQPVVTSGIVTALAGNGFYLQDPAGDGDAATSDGLFVFTSSAPTVAIGDDVSVAGTVTEFFGGAEGLSVTEITNPSVTVLSSGNALPGTVPIGTSGVLPPSVAIEDDGLTSYDPATDGIDFWESLEGMLVTLDTPQAVSNTNGFGEVDVVASLGAGATGMNDRGGISIAAGDFNPEKIQLDDLGGPGFVSELSIGDKLTDVTGVVNYAFNAYEVLLTEDFAVTEDVTLGEETTALGGDLTHLSIATYNLENLDPGDDKFDLLAEDIVYRLGAPDIIAVQEIQDADGAGSGADLSGTVTANLLIAAIEDALGPTYVYIEIAPDEAGSTGGEPGGNIRNGYFYNPERVDYVEGSARLITDAAFDGSRKPLVADFQFNGRTFSAIDVHFTSRGGSDPLWGATQPPADGGAAARFAQAAAVQTYVNDALASDPSLEFAVLGDFNGFYFEDFQQLLTDPGLGGGFTNLNTLLPEAERYSYLFEGNAQQLDNILVTGGLLHSAAYDAVHLNSQMLDTSVRPTDHDPQLALLYFNLAPVAQDDAVAVNEDAMTANLWGTLLANDSDPGSAIAPTIASVDAAGTLGVVLFDEDTQTLQYVADDAAFDALSPGETLADSFAYTIVDADGETSTATVTVTVTGIVDGVTRDGGNGADTVIGTPDEDVLRGGRGDDTVRGKAGDDALYGDQGSDLLRGGRGDDTLFGGQGHDTLRGGADDDRLAGEQGSDTLRGGSGRDVLVGGQGDDWLKGGADGDTFVFGKSSGADTLVDFDLLEDRIAFEDGQSFRSARVQDVDRDGSLDTILTFKTGSAILLGVDDPSSIQFVSGYEADWLAAA